VTAVRWWWPLAVVAVLAHLGLAVLAVVESARLSWIWSEPFDATRVTVIAVSGLLALAGAARVAVSAARGGRAVRRLLGSAGRPVPPQVAGAAAELGIADRVDAVAAAEPFAVTHGLVRPRILVSTGLVATLGAAELVAVLRHERHHLARRDPLRLLATRLLAGYGWYLPVLGWCAERLALRRELAADRAATAGAGPAGLAGALLKLADASAPAAAAAVNPHGSLWARIAQLEGRARVRRPRLGLLRAGTSVAALLALAVAGGCCVAMAGGVLA